MRGPKPCYPIHLSPAQADTLRQLVRAHTTPQTKSLRARIILAAHEHPDWSKVSLGCAELIQRECRNGSSNCFIEGIESEGGSQGRPRCGQPHT